MALDSTTFLKTLYKAGEPQELATENAPLFKMCKKLDDWEGDGNLVVPVLADFGANSVNLFSVANNSTYQNQSAKYKFQLSDRKDYYKFYTISDEQIRASRSNKGAFMQARKLEMDATFRALGQTIARDIYGNGYGKLGSVTAATTGAGGTVTVSVADAAKVSVNQWIIVTTDGKGGNNCRSATPFQVAGVNRSTGVITATGGTSVPAGTTSGDSIHQYGSVDTSATATPAQYGLTGLEALVPVTRDSTTKTVHGLDRSVDWDRLAGKYLAASSAPIEEKLIELTEMIVADGHIPTGAVINNTKYSQLVKQLGSKREYTGEKAEMGFRFVEVHSSAGTIKVFADRYCPSNRAYVGQLDKLEIHSLDEVPHVVKTDGLESLRDSSTDGVGFRFRAWVDSVIPNPAAWGVADLS